MNWQQFADLIYKELTRVEQNALRKIRREYEEVTKKLLGDLGLIFNRISDGKLSYNDIVTARQIQTLQKQAIAQANRLGKFNREVIDKLLADSYELSYAWLGFGIEKAIDKTLENVTPRLPELLQITQYNQMEKIRLNKVMESSRVKITAGIQEAITVGMMQGADFKQMAAEVQKVFTMDYNRALTITETEVHRNREKATNDQAQNASRQGIEMVKVWVNMGDERVRKTTKANHRIIHNQKRPLDVPFDLVNGVQAMMPGHSGTPYNDIRCRCIARYEVVGIKTIGVKEGEAAVKAEFKKWQQSKTA